MWIFGGKKDKKPAEAPKITTEKVAASIKDQKDTVAQLEKKQEYFEV